VPTFLLTTAAVVVGTAQKRLCLPYEFYEFLLAMTAIFFYFWHFGHQNVERPFWTKRRTMPPQPAVWQVSPSRS
jgi:hypothetical protein